MSVILLPGKPSDVVQVRLTKLVIKSFCLFWGKELCAANGIEADRISKQTKGKNERLLHIMLAKVLLLTLIRACAGDFPPLLFYIEYKYKSFLYSSQ